MPLPTSHDLVEVRGEYVYLDGTPVTGSVSFRVQPSALIAEPEKVVIVPAPLVATLDADGKFTIQLPATDDPDINPEGFTYQVTESFPPPGGGGRSYSIDVPLAAAPTGIDIAMFVPVDPNAGTPTAFVTQTGLLSALTPYATLAALAGYAPLSALDDYATLAALDGYAPLDALDDYAPLTALAAYATLTDPRFTTVPVGADITGPTTLAASDAGTVRHSTGASAVTVTVPTNATAAIPVGSVVELVQEGAGQITVAAAGGVTLRAPRGAKSGVQYGSMRLRKRATDVWYVDGDVTT